MCGGPKVSLEFMRQALKAYWAGVEKAPCIFKICNSKSRFYVTAEFSRGNFSRLSRCVGNGREGICSYCELNPGPNVYRPGWLSIIKYIQFIPCLDILRPAKFAQFYIRLYYWWMKELEKGNYISIKFFDDSHVVYICFDGGYQRMFGSLIAWFKLFFFSNSVSF